MFLEKLEAAIVRNQSLLFLGLDPNLEMRPHCYSADFQGLQAWLEWTIEQTADWVCAYKPTLGFYQALGSAGLKLLEQTLAKIPTHIPVILDAKHSDLNSSTALANQVFTNWRVDAITLSPYAGQDLVAPFLVYPDKAVLILCCTSNPAAVAVQHYPTDSAKPLYLHIVEEAKSWGTSEQLGLEVGTADPAILAQIRSIAPERLILMRSIWQEDLDLEAMLAAGLNQDGTGLLIPVPQDWLGQEPLGQLVQSLHQDVNQSRSQVDRHSTCELWTANICTLNQNPYSDLILQLYDVGCILFGEFVQASGAVFPYYIDLRKIISNPQLFHQVLNAYANILQDLKFDRIAGIPYGSLPTATGLALRLNYPMIFPRKEVKAHGTRRVVEGNFQAGETIVVVDDILISGNSVMEGAAKLKSVGLEIQDIVVFLDHEQGVKDRLRSHGYQAHSVLTISEITETLYQAGRITEQQMLALSESDQN